MTHHHFKRFSYSLAGLTLTYVAAVLFFTLVTVSAAQNQAVNETLGVSVSNVDPIDQDLRNIDGELGSPDSDLNPADLSEDEVLGAQSDDEIDRDMQLLDQSLDSDEEEYYQDNLNSY